MKRLFVAALPLSLVFGCTSAAELDELAGETDDDVAADGKADEGAADGAYTYFSITADLRKCAAPVCGGMFLSRINRTTTVCVDGKSHDTCYAPVLDWSEAKLSEAQQQKLVDAANAVAETRAIVRGRFAKTNSTARPELGRFIVTEAWIAEGDGVASGVFVKAKDGGVRCIAAPCASTKETALNTSRSAMIANIDFAPAGLSDHEVEAFGQGLFEPGGIIFAGDRYTVKENGRKAKGRTATAAFHRLADAPGACFVGGCSGQICSEQEGAISTCEWRPEYACYQTATCARQSDGQCGWTETPELQQCLGN